MMMAFRRSHFCAQGSEEAQYYPFQYRLNVRTLLQREILAGICSNISTAGSPLLDASD
jgi:hypothetical protein